MTNLRGKHKQIYNLAVKEVDPQVNWAALVEEKLVRPRLQLGRGRVVGENPTIQCHHSHSEVVVFLMFLMFVSMRGVRLREVQCLAPSHTAEVMKMKTLLGPPSNPGLWGPLQAGRCLASTALPMPWPAHLHGGGARPGEPRALV